MSVADLATHCGLPGRTLRKQFREFMGASPLEFWRRARLAAVRDELLKGANDISVMDTAARFGFNHFGRFSQQYRSYFDEAPSATLFRSRLAERQRIGETREVAMDGDRAVVDTSRSRERPSVAILPCQVSATDPNCRSFGDHLTERIAIALYRSRSLSVAVPTSSRAGSADAKRLARDLGSRYVVATRITQIGQRMRVLMRLLDTMTDFHIWGDTYDGETDDLFGLQDRVTEGIMRAILPHIHEAEIERARRKQPRDLNAYELTMRAFPFAFASNPRAAVQALDLLNRSIEIDPDYAPATALAAWCHAQLVLYNGTPIPEREQTRALLLSDRAGILDLDDPLVLTARCAVHTMSGQLDHAAALVRRALAIEPTFVWGWERSGWVNAYIGESKAAIEHFSQASHLDPSPPNASRLIGIGCAHFDAGRYEQAALWKRKALQLDPGTGWINRTLSVSYARLGDRLAALNAMQTLSRQYSDLTIGRIVSSIPFRRDFLNRVAEGLDGLGVPA
jgi:adenylate cyclase